MSAIEQGLVIGLGMAILAVVTQLCLRAPPGGAVPAQGTRVYRIHGAWFIFSALAGLLLSGLFAFGRSVCEPDLRSFCVACAVLAPVFLALFALILRSFKVTVDETRVTSTTLFIDRSVEIRNVDRVAVAGLVVEVSQKVVPATGKRPRPLVFLAGFKDTAGLIATIQERARAAA